MRLEIPETVTLNANCSNLDLTFGLVFGLLWQGKLSLGQAATALSITRPEFMAELASRDLPLPYSLSEARDDLQLVDQLWPQR
jgi:predicted HTH domain antitoxin